MKKIDDAYNLLAHSLEYQREGYPEAANIAVQDAMDVLKEAAEAQQSEAVAQFDAASFIERKASDYADRFGFGVAGALSFDSQAKTDHYTSLMDLAEEIRGLDRASQKDYATVPPPVQVDTAPMYKALIESRLALLAVNSAASQKAISLIDAIINAAPEPTRQSGEAESEKKRCTCGGGALKGSHSRTCAAFDESMMTYDPFGLARQSAEPVAVHPDHQELLRPFMSKRDGRLTHSLTVYLREMADPDYRKRMHEARKRLYQQSAEPESERMPYLPYLSDRADGVKGHYAITRWVPPGKYPGGYCEYWNLRSHRWAAFSDEVLTLEQATELLRKLEIPTASIRSEK